MKKQKISLCLICTNKYKTFVRPLLEGVSQFFFPGHKIEILVFTDSSEYFNQYEWEMDKNCGENNYIFNIDSRFEFKFCKIPSYGFPEATLYRYNFFTEHAHKITGDYVFYSDVDMKFCGVVDDEIIIKNEISIVAVCHPGFYMSNSGSWCDDTRSKAYTMPVNRDKYYAGGFNGGSRNAFMQKCEIISEMVLIDEANNVKPEHNDEGYLNYFLSTCKFINVLDPTFCMVEQENLRKEWGIAHIKPKIIALNKNHEEIRKA